MAVIAAVELPFAPGSGFKNSRLFVWQNMANGDTGAPVGLGGYTDRAIQSQGVYGVGGTVTAQGTLFPNGTNMVSLVDPQGNAIALTLDKMESILEPSVFFRPAITAGDGTTLLNVYLFMTGGNP